MGAVSIEGITVYYGSTSKARSAEQISTVHYYGRFGDNALYMWYYHGTHSVHMYRVESLARILSHTYTYHWYIPWSFLTRGSRVPIRKL